MKVVCRRVEQDGAGAVAWLTVGREYVVLSVVATADRGVSFRLLDNEGPGPSLWAADLFEVTSAAISREWTAALNDRGTLMLAPSSWQHAGFWEDYFDGVPEAVTAFEAEVKAILAQETDRP